MYIVTGMHRSGTSFMSQALHALGADFGDPARLFPADVWNQNGYFENIDVIDINNRAILGDGAHIRYWLEAPAGAVPRVLNSVRSRKWKYFLFPSPSAIHRRAEAYGPQMDALMAEYRGRYVKDPRFCLTLGAWAKRGAIEGLVFSFRNPWAVAGSVARRERLPRLFGLRYWLYHVRGFMAQVPPQAPVLMVDFDAFFDAGRQAGEFARVAHYLGHGDGAADAGALAQTLDIRLRTQASETGTAPRHVARAYEGLRQLHAASGDGVVRMADHPETRQAILG